MLLNGSKLKMEGRLFAFSPLEREGKIPLREF
jgi:hypothetical protein